MNYLPLYFTRNQPYPQPRDRLNYMLSQTLFLADFAAVFSGNNVIDLAFDGLNFWIR